MTTPSTTAYAPTTPARVSPALAVLLGLSVMAHGLVLLVQLDFSAVYTPPHTSMLRVKLATQTTPSDNEPASTVTTAIADSMVKPKQPAASRDATLSAEAHLAHGNVLTIEADDNVAITQQTVDSTQEAGPKKIIPTPAPARPTAPASMAKSTLVMNTAAISGTLTEAALKSQASDTSHPPTNERQTLLEEIHRALSRHVDYPLRARRRGWEGEVLLAFNLSQLGLIDNIHIARSSGYSLLDESALNAMQKVKGISWRLYEGRLPMTGLEIPVLYRLTDG